MCHSHFSLSLDNTKEEIDEINFQLDMINKGLVEDDGLQCEKMVVLLQFNYFHALCMYFAVFFKKYFLIHYIFYLKLNKSMGFFSLVKMSTFLIWCLLIFKHYLRNHHQMTTNKCR